MAERTTGLEVDELLLPENCLEKYEDPTGPPNEGAEDVHQAEADGSNKERAQENTKELAKTVNGAKKSLQNKPEPPEKVLSKLVGISHSPLHRLAHSPVDPRSK